MTVSPLHIDQKAWAAVIADCQARRPEEACGILLADPQGRIVEAVATENVWPDAVERVRRFAIDPLVQLKVEQQATADGRQVVGFYHSHPGSPAVPSEFDLSRAWPAYVYVIVGLSHGDRVEFRVWGLDAAGAFVEHAVSVEH